MDIIEHLEKAYINGVEEDFLKLIKLIPYNRLYIEVKLGLRFNNKIMSILKNELRRRLDEKD